MEILGGSAETRALHRKQDGAVEDFTHGIRTVSALLGKAQSAQFDRGEWTFTVSPGLMAFTAVLRGEWEFPGKHQCEVDRAIKSAGFELSMSDPRIFGGVSR
ncbi:MAG: hypothetical protein E6Q97_29805 [Desulfurellales bacterium]|nr:MAG: hypothetical protein E6Q97_29805 [Desulfurellales bacterium]